MDLGRILDAARPSTLVAHRKTWLVAGLLFLVAFLPRSLDLGQMTVIDELLWLNRSRNFTLALKARDWGGTIQSAHPGVTTTWFSGTSMLLYCRVRGLDLGQEGNLTPTQVRELLLPAQLSTAWVTSLAVVGFYLLLRRLLNPPEAILAAFLAALDPFFIAHSRVAHVDALLSVFMVLSVLAFLTFVKEKTRWPLFLSGFAAGLAFLTKMPSFFLIPFTIVICVISILGWSARGKPDLSAPFRWRALVRAARSLGLWFACAVAVILLLWPVLWVRPIGTISHIVDRSAFSLTTAHDPSLGYTLQPGYYLRAILFYTTPVTILSFLLFVALTAWRLRKGWNAAREGSTPQILALLAFMALFVFTMTLGAKKGERYILPAFIAIDILGAVGLYWGLKALTISRRLLWAGAAIAISIQVVLLFSVHPYYLAAYNRLLPKPVEAKMGWGEGLELAAAYLNEKEGAEKLAVSSWYPSVFATFFSGRTEGLGDRGSPSVSYVVLYRGMLGRGEHSSATQVLREFRGVRVPEKTIYINGLDYVWIYRK